jgi:hypothetical protein
MVDEILDLFSRDYIIEAYGKLRAHQETLNPSELEEFNKIPQIDALRKDVEMVERCL